MNGYERDFEAKEKKKGFETSLMVFLLLLRASEIASRLSKVSELFSISNLFSNFSIFAVV